MEIMGNTAEVIERITTERKELKQELKDAISYQQVLMGVIRAYEDHIEHLEAVIERLKAKTANAEPER